MPCSGLNNAASVTPGAFAIRSIVLTPSRDLPVWFVSRPTRLPRSRYEVLRREDIDAGQDRRMEHELFRRVERGLSGERPCVSLGCLP